MTDLLDELFEKHNILCQAKDKISEHSDDYKFCIKGTKGNNKEKKIAAQVLQRFFKHFPDLQNEAINALVDLCEQTDSEIRIVTIKLLPLICKDSKGHVTQIAHILSQLLQLDDDDYAAACTSLIQLYKEDPLNTVKSVLASFTASSDVPIDENFREKCISFLFTKLIKTLPKLPSEVEDLLIEDSKKIIDESNAVEFSIVMPFLTNSKLTKTTTGQQELVDLVAERAELSIDYDPLEDGNDNTSRLITCVKSILPLFNANVESTKFVKYYCEQILPHWKDIGKLDNSENIKFELLKQLAELSIHCGKLEEPQPLLKNIFDKLKEYMPPPPEDADVSEMPELNFTVVECLLFAFHRLARQSPEFLTSDPEVLKDFRARLTYFSRGVQGCRRGLEKTVSSKKDLTDEESEKVKLAPAVFDNISTLIKDLFFNPPMYKCNVQLSFKTVNNRKKLEEKSPAGTKRHVPITFDSSNGSSTKQGRSENMKLYTPPSGKFSNNFSRSGGPRGRGRGGPRGGMRGRPMRGGWRN